MCQWPLGASSKYRERFSTFPIIRAPICRFINRFSQCIHCCFVLWLGLADTQGEHQRAPLMNGERRLEAFPKTRRHDADALAVQQSTAELLSVTASCSRPQHHPFKAAAKILLLLQSHSRQQQHLQSWLSKAPSSSLATRGSAL